MRPPLPIGLLFATGFCLAALFYRQDPTGFLITVTVLPGTALALFYFWIYRYKEPIVALLAAWIFLTSTATLEPLVFHRAPALLDSLFVIALLWLVVRDVAFRQNRAVTVLYAVALSVLHAALTHFTQIMVDLVAVALVAIAPTLARLTAKLHADVLAPIKVIDIRTAQIIGSFFLVLLGAITGFALINYSVFSVLPEQYSLKDPASPFAGFQQSASIVPLVFLFESWACTFNQSYTQIKPVGVIALSLGFAQALTTWTLFSVYLKFLLSEPKPNPPHAIQ